MEDFSGHKHRNSVWLSPPFYVGGVGGWKLRLAVYAGGIHPGAGRDVFLVIQDLKPDTSADLGPEVTHESAIRVVIGSHCCTTKALCSLDHYGKFHELRNADAIHCDHMFVPYDIAKQSCSGDTLPIAVALVHYPCDSVCKHHVRDNLGLGTDSEPEDVDVGL